MAEARVFKMRVATMLMAGVLAFAAAHSVAADSASDVQFGPIRFGMSIDQIRAAVPDAHWQITTRSKFTDKPCNMQAVDALDYGGWRMNIDVRDEKYDRHVELSARRTVTDAVACEQAGLQLLAALEDSAGTLQSSLDPGAESVAFGRGSMAMFNGFDARSKRIPRKSLGSGRVTRFAAAD